MKTTGSNAASLGATRRRRVVAIALGLAAAFASGDASAADPRLENLVDLRADPFPFDPPDTPEAWAARAADVRRQVLVAAGLWPMPDRPEPYAEVLRKVERDGYTIEAVRLESFPGHSVTGSLYRPTGEAAAPRPGVLCPHGHWGGGRFHAWKDDELAPQLESGAERYETGGRTPLQARCVQLARMGCVVFLYDMLGYGDSRQISLLSVHAPSEETVLDDDDAWGFYSTQAELRLQGPLGVQTFNSLCALDWLESLPDVDPKRLAVTGGSSGATQTLMLCAVDDRPAVAFPVVMVSTAMQGGCGCENACCLRLGTSNVEFAALMAPRPLGMASANDWTRNTATDGYPELQKLYAMLGVPDRVTHASLVQFPHNYNYASRAAMYPWLDRWLGLESGDRVVETDYEPVTPAEVRMTAPIDDAEVDRQNEVALMRAMEAKSQEAMQRLAPTDADSLAEYRQVVGGALRVLLDHADNALAGSDYTQEAGSGRSVNYARHPIHNSDADVDLPGFSFITSEYDAVVVFASSKGAEAVFSKTKEIDEVAAQLIGKKIAVIGVDLFAQGRLAPADGPLVEMPLVPSQKPVVASHNYGYNRSGVAHRASDLLAAIGAANKLVAGRGKVGVVAIDGTAPYAAAALAVAGDAVDAALIDTSGFRFSRLNSWRDPNFLPGAVKYGDLPGLLALGAPRPLVVLGESAGDVALATQAYAAAGADDRLIVLDAEATLESAIDRMADVLSAAP